MWSSAPSLHKTWYASSCRLLVNASFECVPWCSLTSTSQRMSNIASAAALPKCSRTPFSHSNLWPK